MDLLDTPVRLVVKAPNQRVSDQTIDCALSWTVRKLKTYISEVYPNQPKTEEQKLIYSGQLLHDHLMLKDVLRQYERNNTHIVHLVCASSKDNLSTKATLPENTTPKENPVPTPDTTNDDGVRQRRTESRANNSIPATSYPPNYAMYTGSYYNSPQGLLMTPEQMTQQLMWMQQMYTQYMTQYMQYAQMSTNPTSTQTSLEPTSEPVIQAPINPPVENNPAPRVAAPNENVRMNAQGGPVDDDDEEFDGNRDWLDWFYLSSRALVLFSIVYFYSSLSRFIAVTFIVILFYLYRTNWFQRRRRARQVVRNDDAIPLADVVDNNARNDDNNNRAQQAAAAAPGVNQEQRERREIENVMENDLDNPLPPVDLGPSIFTVTWAFISGFFTSLMPEQPAQVN